MKKSIKTIAALFLASAMCFGLSSVAFAGDTSLEELVSALEETSADDTAVPASETAESDIPEDAIVLDGTSSDELVLVDDDNCTVTITGFDDNDDYYSFVMDIFLENKSDLNLYYTFNNVSVNDYMCDPWWGQSVSSGHKANSELTFWSDDFDKNNITKFRRWNLPLKFVMRIITLIRCWLSRNSYSICTELKNLHRQIRNLVMMPSFSWTMMTLP